MPIPAKQRCLHTGRAHATGPRPVGAALVSCPDPGSPGRGDVMRDRLTELREENLRLKRELRQRDGELAIIRQKFSKIVDELRRKDARVPLDGGDDPPPPPLNRGRPEDRDAEAYIAEQQRRLQLARRELEELRGANEDLQKECKKLARGRAEAVEAHRRMQAALQGADEMRAGWAELTKRKDAWQRKYKELRAWCQRQAHPLPPSPPPEKRRVPRGTGGQAAAALQTGTPAALPPSIWGLDPLDAGAHSGRAAAGSPTRVEFASVGVGQTPALPGSAVALGQSGKVSVGIGMTPHTSALHPGARTPGAATPMATFASPRRDPDFQRAVSPRGGGAQRLLLDTATSPIPDHGERGALHLPPAPVKVVHTDAQTCPWGDLLAFERSRWEREQGADRRGVPFAVPAPSGVIDVLQRENTGLEARVAAAAEQLAAAEARCQRLQDERDMLINAAGGDPAEPGDGGAEERAVRELQSLQQEVASKNAQLVLLDGRFRQATASVTDLKRANEQILQEMRKMSDNLAGANQRCMEAENSLQVAQLGQGRVESLEALLRDKDAEVRELMAANRELLAGCHTARTETEGSLRSEWERRVEEKGRALEESERNNRRLFRESQLQEQQLDQLRKDLARARRERDEGKDELARLREEVRELHQRLKLFGTEDNKVTAEDEEDVHKALALIQHHRRRGDPTDLEFLMATWDSGAAELQDVRAENLRLVREIEESRKLLRVWQERSARDAERLEGLRRAGESKQLLTEAQRDQIWELQAEAAQLRGKVTRDSDAASVATAEGENVLELGLGHLRASKECFAHPDGEQGKPPTFFVSADFFDFDTVVSAGASGVSSTFDETFCFTVTVSRELLHCVKHGAVELELNQQQGLAFEVVGRASIPLKALIAGDRGCLRHCGHVRFTNASGEEIAELEYHLAVKHPFPSHWREEADTVSADSGASPYCPLSADLMQAFRSVRALRINIREALDLHRASASEPVPYVMVTAAPADGPLRDATAEMAQPRHTYNPRFHWEHHWEVTVDGALCRYLRDCVLHFVVLDDAGHDPRAPPLGRATLRLAPMLEGPGRQADTPLPLLNDSGADVGVLDVGLRWVRDLGHPAD
eukprot:TRINITY_DN21_c0_g3_i1.p1 TRINITY_DN21_c0_g3~~TRINITY_DN21_c0_g3_i1.p1  ORF type:complete len:1128 (+),score=425.58 TRINITY_DN21_c0_g3_i1:66-3386(+)